MFPKRIVERALRQLYHGDMGRDRLLRGYTEEVPGR